MASRHEMLRRDVERSLKDLGLTVTESDRRDPENLVFFEDGFKRYAFDLERRKILELPQGTRATEAKVLPFRGKI